MAVISNKNLIKHVCEVHDINGDFAEIGVFRADTFKRLAPLATIQGKEAHGFDSFEGMAPPSNLDFGNYPEGKLSVGGVSAFMEIMDQNGIKRDTYKLFPGFIPSCFSDIDQNQKYSLALVDVDQWEPTVASLSWIWPKLSIGAILILDDYFKEREGLAAKAIDDWLTTLHPLDFVFLEYTDTQLVIKKQFIKARPLPAALCK